MKSSGFAEYAVVSMVGVMGFIASFFVFQSVIAANVSSQVTVANAAPTVSAVTLNGGNAITLTANTTTSINVTFTVSDNNGCSDVFTGGAVTTTVYRSGAGGSCSANNQNCYIATTNVNGCSSGTSANATATVNIYYFAQATDASSTFPSENWLAQVSARDAANASHTATSTAVELNTLTAINVLNASIAYGSVPAGTNTGATTQSVNTTNAGNSATTLQVAALQTLTSGANSIATSSQHYASSTFTYGGSEAALSNILTGVTGFLLTNPTSTSLVQANTYWGLAVPAQTPTGSYTGTNTFSALFQ